MSQKFLNLSSPKSRKAIQDDLATNKSVTITFEKDDGTLRTINCTLNAKVLPDSLRSVEINKPRSIFLKAYDIQAQTLKTIRWEKIVNVTPIAVNPSPIAKPVAVTKTPATTATSPATTAVSKTLLADLQAAGFRNGQAINDVMLERFATIREERVKATMATQVAVLTQSKQAAAVEAAVLKDSLAKIGRILASNNITV
jgi:hypothetical protein